MKKQQKETAEEFRCKLEASPVYWKSLEEDVAIILAGEKAGRWKTLEEIEEEQLRRKLN